MGGLSITQLNAEFARKTFHRMVTILACVLSSKSITHLSNRRLPTADGRLSSLVAISRPFRISRLSLYDRRIEKRN